MENRYTEAQKQALLEIKQSVRDNIRWDLEYPERKGGQQCGVSNSLVTLISEDLNLKITLGHDRSVVKNKELIYTLFELVLDEFVK